MRSSIFSFGLVLALAVWTPSSLSGQDPAPVAGIPNVFFDCNGPNCNSTYYRTEIDWVNWVRDRQDAQIHLIMTSQSTGAGGREYVLAFNGVGRFSDYEQELRFRTLATDTDREALDGVAHAISLGMAHFANEAGYRGLLRIEGLGGAVAQPGLLSSQEVDDPWNLWVFRINGSANFDGEDTRSNRRLTGFVSGSRVTPTWKMSFNGSMNYNQRRVELTDEPDFVDERTDWSLTQLVVYSIADHWSIGFRSEVRRLVSFNQAFRAEFTPAVEYSFFPYAEATRRSLTAYYQVGPAYRDYIDSTIFDQESETRFEQAVELEFSQRQEWGDASISVRGSHYLHDLGLYNVSLRGNVDFRVVRGFSINARGNMGWVKDQIYLAAKEASTEEELLDLVRRAQSYTYGGQIGITLQFGSIFNNVVNNRFNRARGGGGFGGGGDGGGSGFGR